MPVSAAAYTYSDQMIVTVTYQDMALYAGDMTQYTQKTYTKHTKDLGMVYKASTPRGA